MLVVCGGQARHCTDGLAGTGCTAWDGQKDRNHWCLPACGQARQRRPFADSRCVRATHSWVGFVLENPVDAHRKFERYRAAQIAVDVDKNTLERLFPKGHVNKLGLIIKESPERRKLRIVVDIRRSKANARAAVPERPILPRPRDIVADWEELFSESASLRFTTNSGVSCDNVTCDFSDAYCHVLVHAEELKNCLVAAPPSVALMCRMGFGSKGAPLTWCRIEGARGRAAQAMLMGARWSGHAAGRVNTYIDDPLLNVAWHTNAARRAEQLFWTAAGFQVAWAVGTRSKVAKWIGLEFAPDFQSQTVTVRNSSRMRKNCWSHRCFL